MSRFPVSLPAIFLLLLTLVACGDRQDPLAETGEAGKAATRERPDWFAGHTLYEVHVRAASRRGTSGGCAGVWTIWKSWG